MNHEYHVVHTYPDGTVVSVTVQARSMSEAREKAGVPEDNKKPRKS